MGGLTPYLLVGAGGFVGANARFMVARLIDTWFQGRFPLGTFLVNVSGSFLAGALGAVVAARIAPESEATRLALGVGFLGAYTTFSTFEVDTHALLGQGSWLAAAVNVAGSVFIGLAAVRAGIVVANVWTK